MPDHDHPGRTPPNARRPTTDRIKLGATLIAALSGVMGATGVGVSAAAAHLGGGTLVSTAGTFLLLHAAAGLGLAALALASPAHGWGLVLSALLLAIGTIAFAGDLALIGLAGFRPVPAAAPLGGLLMIAGWIGVPVALLLGRRSKT